MLAGGGQIGVMPYCATRESRTRRPPVQFAAMLQSERMPQQSSRPLDPVEPLKPPRQKGCSENVGAAMSVVKVG